MRNLIIAVVVISVILGIAFWSFGSTLINSVNKPNPENQPVNLVWWGLIDEETAYRTIITSYEAIHPNVKITYSKQSPLNYRPRLQTQLRAGQGPDIFMIHSSWVPMFTGDLAAAPETIFPTNDFNSTFYSIAKDNLVVGNRVYGIPMEVDGLALYYNEDLLKFAGVTPPKTWQQFLDAGRKLTVKNETGQIQTSGAALGTATNVDNWPEILGLLFLQQPSTTLTSPGTKGGGDVLRFYTSFVIDPQNKTWDVTLPQSTQMFVDGKLAFYFADAKKATEIQNANPTLKFKVIPVPQLPGGDINWGSFWGYSVAVKPTFTEAWKFLQYLSTPQSLQVLYQQKTQNQSVGSAFPRRDMAALLVNDPVLGAYINEAPTMKGWYLNSNASDSGINDEVITLYKEAVDKVLQGTDPEQSLQGMNIKIKQVIDKYTKPVATPTKK
ncbi:MAG: extracellular solute-binding protein [Candidatus Daviesbacteria bacterium]|nr:extracellular solute-binding protein [Candidatus Daviesbacteria bacterium]